MVRELNPKLAKIAKDELNEDWKRIQEDLKHIKDWISKQSYLKARTDDQWLVAILRGCKFSLETVKKKLDLYYTLRSTASDITLRLKPSGQNFLEFLRFGSCLILPEAKTSLFPRVIVIRPGAYDPNKHVVTDLMCAFYYLVQILVMECDTATVLGTKIIVDYQGVSASHITQVNIAIIKKMIAVFQDSMPLRLKGSHHINMPPSVDMIFSLVKGLLNEKAKQRLMIHRTHNELMEHIPKEILPAEYGGNGGKFSEIIDYWANKIVEYKPWMQLEEKLGTDESRRPGKPKTAEDMFGVDGSFRKLDID